MIKLIGFKMKIKRMQLKLKILLGLIKFRVNFNLIIA